MSEELRNKNWTNEG